jgi:predicted Zn-dependent protease
MSSQLPSTQIDRNPPPSNRQLLILFGLFVGFIIAVVWIVWSLVNNLIWFIPPSVEQQLGALVVPAYEQQAKSSPAQDTLNQLLDRLETNLPEEQKQGRNYQVLYIPQATVNALAIPGDRIIIYAGLLDKMTSENELMMVMGHELGHFAHRDHLRGLGRQLFLQMAIATIFGDVSWLQGTAAAVQAVSQAQFSQSQETEADEFGLTLLQATYGQVAGATDFFAQLNQQKGINLAFLATHPNPGDRVIQLNRLIKARKYQVGERSPLPETLSNLKVSLGAREN